MAISLFSKPYEIASVVSLPRNDITTQFLRGDGKDGEFDLYINTFFPLPLSRFSVEPSILNPNPDLGNCHCERSEAIPPCSMRLPRLRAETFGCTYLLQ